MFQIVPVESGGGSFRLVPSEVLVPWLGGNADPAVGVGSVVGVTGEQDVAVFPALFEENVLACGVDDGCLDLSVLPTVYDGVEGWHQSCRTYEALLAP